MSCHHLAVPVLGHTPACQYLLRTLSQTYNTLDIGGVPPEVSPSTLDYSVWLWKAADGSLTPTPCHPTTNSYKTSGGPGTPNCHCCIVIGNSRYLLIIMLGEQGRDRRQDPCGCYLRDRHGVGRLQTYPVVAPAWDVVIHSFVQRIPYRRLETDTLTHRVLTDTARVSLPRPFNATHWRTHTHTHTNLHSHTHTLIRGPPLEYWRSYQYFCGKMGEINKWPQGMVEINILSTKEVKITYILK